MQSTRPLKSKILSLWLGVVAAHASSLAMAPFLVMAPSHALAQAPDAGVQAKASAGTIHEAPVIIKAQQLRQLSNFPVQSYRLFKTDPSGLAIPIPFQIDEMNEWGDFVLDKGSGASYAVGNGIFDQLDELSLMGNDIGSLTSPSRWGTNKPNQLYKIEFSFSGNKLELKEIDKNAASPVQGAVFLGVYFANPPELSKKWYVKFDLPEAQVTTDRYRYRFNKDNYLIVRGVEVAHKTEGGEYEFAPLLDASAFYLNVDMKFFLSMEIGAYDVKSKLEAYKMGPIRSIVRVSFNYELLRLKFDLGMYTEVSFFANAVFLPAVFFNPLNGPTRLNKGSGFYYGFSLVDSPRTLNIDTNLGQYVTPEKQNSGKDSGASAHYWIAAKGENEFFYLRLIPSAQMRKVKYTPAFYYEDKTSVELQSRSKSKAQPLGKSPVNLAMYFDLSKFDEGEHLMTFQLYFENKQSDRMIHSIKTLHQWMFNASRLEAY